MAVFRFSMQNILNMKEKLEEQEKNNFAQANRRLLEAEEELERLKRRLLKKEEELREAVSELTDIREVRTREDAVEIVKMYVKQQQLVVIQRQKEVEVARQRLQEAMKERKTFEKLREKAFEAFVGLMNAYKYHPFFCIVPYAAYLVLCPLGESIFHR